MSRSALSLAAGMDRGAASQLEASKRIPRVDTVERIANVLGISACVLAFGMEQADEPCEGLRSAGLPARLTQTRQARGLSRTELGNRSATSDTFVRTTETGETMPNLAKVEALARALAVSPCWLAFGIGPQDMTWSMNCRPPSTQSAS